VESREFGSHGKQLEYALRLVSLLDASTPPSVILDVLSLQAQSFIDIGKADRLGSVLSAAQTLANETGDQMRAATIRHLRARARYFSGEDRASIPESEQSVIAQRALGGDGTKHPDPTRLYRQLLDHVGMLQGVALDVDALPSLRLAERILPQVRNPTRLAIDLDYAFASLFTILGDQQAAAKRLNAALDKAIEVGDVGWQSEIHGALAGLYLERGELDKAIEAGKRYRAIAIADNNLLGEANAEISLADGYTGLGNLAAAAAASKRAIELFDGLDDTFNRADARRAHAYVLALQGNAAKARDYLSQSVKLRPDNTSLNWAYFVAKVRTAIAVASRDDAAARAAIVSENKHALARNNFNRITQTNALREYHEVNARELQLESLRRESELREAERRRDQIRILWQRIAIVASLLLLSVVAVLLAYFYVRARRLRITADTDALTNVFSRAAILARANSMCDLARQEGRSVAACVLDIDQFKRFNDMHGHATGDRVLALCVRVMQNNVRQLDLIGRIGGDEFLIMMDDIDEAHAVGTANRILAALRVTAMGEANEDLHATVSAGVSAFVPSERGLARTLIRQADTALLEAKKRGKNRVMAFTAIVDGSSITDQTQISETNTVAGR
jgi:diguanylate cyclase (GGDEF)-like protein